MKILYLEANILLEMRSKSELYSMCSFFYSQIDNLLGVIDISVPIVTLSIFLALRFNI